MAKLSNAEYNVGDILPAMSGGLSHDGTLYAAPFYGESSMIMYRTDLSVGYVCWSGKYGCRRSDWNGFRRYCR